MSARRIRYATWSLAFAPFFAATGCAPDQGLPDGVSEVHANAVSTSDEPWKGLLHPVAIEADAAGRIYVGDRGRRSVAVFDSRGRHLDRFGSSGSGPGELTDVRTLTVLEDEVVVSDLESGRLVRFGLDGRYLGGIPNPESAETTGGLGDDRLIVASSPGWAMTAALDPEDGTLFRILDPAGEDEASGGARHPTENPFVGHIRNFVHPAGARDGSFVWLAHLNHPSILQISLRDPDGSRRLQRRVPFDWRELPPEFEPSEELMARGRDAPPPFDAITLDVATDQGNRLFVLTALSSTGSGEAPVASVGVDVLHPERGWTHRIPLPDPGSALAVSPDGSRLYVLDEPTARIHVYGWSDDA